LRSVSEIRSVHEAADLFREAVGEGRRVSIEREGGDVVLSTGRLDQMLEHEAGDLTCIVESGLRVRDLNERLAEHGQMLALDPPGNPTIGACLAANLSGPRRHRYGTARDLVIGVTVVLADGTVASSGGKVVKNVAGYDLGKLFCGSEGRLGLIARVRAAGVEVVRKRLSDDGELFPVRAKYGLLEDVLLREADALGLLPPQHIE